MLSACPTEFKILLFKFYAFISPDSGP